MHYVNNRRALSKLYRALLVALALTSAAGALSAVPSISLAALPSTQSEIECRTAQGVANLEIRGEATPVASPEAVMLASPVAIQTGAGVLPPEMADQIEHAVRVIAVCQTERELDTLVNLVTERFLSDAYAGGGQMTKEQFIALGAELPRATVSIRSVDNVQLGPDGRISADVESTVSRQLFNSRWTFVFVPEPEGDATGDEPGLGHWQADSVQQLPVDIPEGAKTTRVVLEDNKYDPKNLRVNGPDIVISGTNKGKQSHEMLVLQLANNASVSELLLDSGAALPRGFTVMGQLTIPPGEKGQLVLVGMKRRDYVIVDLLPDPNGTPHLALGMQATLTIR